MSNIETNKIKSDIHKIKYYIKQCDNISNIFAILVGMAMLIVIGYIDTYPIVSVISLACAIVFGFIYNYFDDYVHLLYNKLYILADKLKR